MFFQTLYLVCVFESVAPYFSVASTVCHAIMAKVDVMKRAQSLREGFLIKAAEVLEWATSPGMGSWRKFLVMATRAMDFS